MKPTHRSSIHPHEVGGAARQPRSADSHAAESDNFADSLYTPQPQIAPTRRIQRLKRQQQARAIAESRLTQIGEDLVGLADELRALHPDLSDSLDDAWSDVEQALELLLDEASW
ncbi:MAG: hypothetical protein OHK0037_07300 [Elainellaceae cyanobacterium]